MLRGKLLGVLGNKLRIGDGDDVRSEAALPILRDFGHPAADGACSARLRKDARLPFLHARAA